VADSPTSTPATPPDPLARLIELVERIAVAVETTAPEGLAPRDAAALVGVSVSKWHYLNAHGLCPQPAELGEGRLPRWSRGELVAWLRAGAPARARWATMRENSLRKLGAA
jgi:predicted DNA-binding transcriptional regulator AlpA